MLSPFKPLYRLIDIGIYKESISILHRVKPYLCKIYIKYCKFMR